MNKSSAEPPLFACLLKFKQLLHYQLQLMLQTHAA